MNRVHYSQYNESKLIDKMLNGKRSGFIVEAGAFDGETFSNSLFFEKERDFSGILIEPLPLSYERLLEKNRKFYSINACIAQKVPTVAKFKMFKAGAFSGRSKSFKDSKNKPLDYEFIYVPCFSIQTILAAINVKTVDLFSLDVEGGELDVLKSINFDKIRINSFAKRINGHSIASEKETPINVFELNISCNHEITIENEFHASTVIEPKTNAKIENTNRS
ncbi:Star [Brachionus plicatilis]|uniref:Star n=1 Tax=Brachionus plicatilis TaxID=10195 RepID=A0A3M7PWF9_BRAPC|nr:Star [Brachionus plicatilis]